MFAVIGSVLIFISAIAIADRLLDGVDASIRGVSAVRVILERTKVLIECYALPADEILKRIDASLFADCGYAGEAPKSFAELADGAKISDGETAELFSAFSKDFGKSYRQDELSRCALYLERLRSREQKLLKEAAKRKKIIITLSICSALALVILIL